MYTHLAEINFGEGETPLLVKQINLINAYQEFFDLRTQESLDKLLSISDFSSIEDTTQYIVDIITRIEELMVRDNNTEKQTSVVDFNVLDMLFVVPCDLWNRLSLPAALYYVYFQKRDWAIKRLELFETLSSASILPHAKDGKQVYKDHVGGLIYDIEKYSQPKSKAMIEAEKANTIANKKFELGNKPGFSFRDLF
jgi:hypothetical protein